MRDYVLPNAARVEMLKEIIENVKSLFTEQEKREHSVNQMYRAHLSDDIAKEVIAYIAYQKLRIQHERQLLLHLPENSEVTNVNDDSFYGFREDEVSRTYNVRENRRHTLHEQVSEDNTDTTDIHETGTMRPEYINMPEMPEGQRETTMPRRETRVDELYRVQRRIDKSLLPVTINITEMRDNINKITDALRKANISVEENNDKNQYNCCVCYFLDKCIMFVPCNHVACCVECAKNIMEINSKCPICNNFAQYTEKVYI